MRVALAARSLALVKSWLSESPSVSKAAIMRLRSAARWTRAISGRRAANHSTCCSLMRSQGGLPITASKPPSGSTFFRFVHTPGNAACQLRKRSSAMRVRARSSSPANRWPSGVAGPSTSLSLRSGVNGGVGQALRLRYRYAQGERRAVRAERSPGGAKSKHAQGEREVGSGRSTWP